MRGWLPLEPGETKNGEGRMFPLTPGDMSATDIAENRIENRRVCARFALISWTQRISLSG